MTDLNNSNDDEERPNDASHGGGSPMDDLDAAWAEFADSHADDLKAVERSRSAKRFEKHAQRREKEALLSIDDLDQARSPMMRRRMVVGRAISLVRAGLTRIGSWTVTVTTSCRRILKSAM